MRKLVQIIFLAAILVHGTASQAMARKAKASTAELDVKAAMVVDFTTGSVLQEQNADTRIPPASITKIMTMYLVFEDLEAGRLRTTDQVAVSPRAASAGGSSMHLRAGETVTIMELLDGMAVASGNDACIAVAEHLGGVDAFVNRMNRKARELGMSSTTFENPNGLPSPGQFTTARDMMKLAVSYLKRFPRSLDHHSKTTISHRGHVRQNSNKLLQTCDGVDGIKTGWVAASGYNIVATAKRGNTRIIAVVLGGRSWQIRNRETQHVLEASFSPQGGQKTYLAEAAPPRRGARITLADPASETAFAPGPHAGGQATVQVAAIDESQATVIPVAGSQLRAPVAPSRPRRVARDAAPADTAVSRPSQAQTDTVFAPSAPHLVIQAAATSSAAPAPERSRGHSELTLQESSFQTPGEASARARHLEKKGVPARVVSADLGDKGVWYRVMIGSFSSMQEARRYKQQLSNRLELAHLIIREG